MISQSGVVISVVVWALLYLPILLVTNATVQEAYMDEYFHVNIAKNIQSHPYRIDKWDSNIVSKITTPPGIYYISLALTGWQSDLYLLRFTSALFNCLSVGAVSLILAKRQPNNARVITALKIMSFPPLFFVGQLYYTDAGGLFFILLAWLCSEYGYTAGSLFSCLISLSIRQTNAIWMLFIGGMEIVAYVDSLLLDREHKYDPVAALAVVITNWKIIGLRYGLYIILPLVYVLGILQYNNNGSLVFGDQDNHQVIQHWSQLSYLSIFLGSFSGLGFDILFTPITHLRILLSHTAIFIVLYGLNLGFVHRFTVIHKFTMADNRHYAFYLWKNFLRKNDFFKYVPVPGYAVGHFFILQRLLREVHPLVVAGFLLALGLSLVPLPLLEPRYFIVPSVIYSILVRSDWEYVTFTCNMVINGIVCYVFLFKPFTWNDGSVARFMW